MCFHIIDLYRGKVKFHWWFKLIISSFSQFPRIRFRDEWTQLVSPPVSIPSALRALDVWSRANVDNRYMPRSVWQDFNAIRGRFKSSSSTLIYDPGREIIYPGILHPHLVDYVSYGQADFLQAPHHLVHCCPANLETRPPFSISFVNMALRQNSTYAQW